ncbi:M9 family metallopeptidase [Tahibacter caeni]|uniref:M9 family metallopeptidase n=1 Tax=Tahibacter caeni TaxID=1453545 RepID=UPI0021473043|nr:M9 family metallopeptidase [Tahibacter caeni]
MPGPTAAAAARDAAAHVQIRPIAWDRRAPLPSSRAHLFRAYDAPDARPQAADACNIAGFASASGAALVAAVRAADAACFYSGGLFDVTGATAGQIFAESKMVTIANAMQADAASYSGDNSNHMYELVLFLRAGLYVQYYNATDVGDYGAAFTNAIRPALNAFVANGHFQDVNDAHGKVLAEFVTLIDSAGENAAQLDTVRGILDRYGPGWSGYSSMQAAANNVFTVLFRGHYDPAFQALVQGSGSGVLDTLVNFINDNRAADVGSSREYLLQNAAGELGRFTQYPAAAFHDLVHPRAKSVLDQFTIGGPGGGIYVRIASVVDYYDHGHCAYFGLCTFAQDLETQVLPAANARDCSATLRVRSQSLTSAQLDQVCSTVGAEEGYFHAQAQTGNTPVPNDFNTKLEMVIFHSSGDYETYSGIIFGNDTNNGGIYLEGDPSDPANQARFLAYEAEWLRPNFEIWNLTHEYIHYLDGRFNWYGGFGALPMDAPYSAIWYIEGFAEYLSYSYRNLRYASAVAAAGNPDAFTLAQLFDTEYSTDYARTYQWGYLATRFMFERHRDRITSLYAISRPGNYSPGYANWVDPIRTAYDAEFRSWLVCFAAHDGDTTICNGGQPDLIFADDFGSGPPECTDADAGRLGNGCKRSDLSAATPQARVYLTILVPAGVNSLTFRMSGGAGDADIYHRAGSWPTEAAYDHAPQLVGNEETVTVAAPAAGWHYLMLKPHTNASTFSGVEVAASWQ